MYGASLGMWLSECQYSSWQSLAYPGELTVQGILTGRGIYVEEGGATWKKAIEGRRKGCESYIFNTFTTKFTSL